MIQVRARRAAVGSNGRMGREIDDERAGRQPAAALPLVYSCSGCSSAAQMANRMALWLDAERLAEMSCIAGVGGGVEALVRTARSGRPIVALDGCVLHCSRACLANAGVTPDLHLTLSEFGVRKRRHCGFDEAEAQRVLATEIVPRIHSLQAPEDDGHAD